MDRLAAYNAIQETRLVPLFYIPRVSAAIEITAACLRGGAKVIEFTHRGHQALAVFTALRKQFTSTQAIIGIGTILDAATAAHYIALGADFVVSPIFDPTMASLCHRHGIAYIPGAASPTEIMNALSHGVEMIKLFPASALGGPLYLRTLLSPMPWLKLLPTGGIPLDKNVIHAWLEAGAVALGMGSELIRRDWIIDEKFDLVEEAVRNVLGWIHESEA